MCSDIGHDVPAASVVNEALRGEFRSRFLFTGKIYRWNGNAEVVFAFQHSRLAMFANQALNSANIPATVC
jgi:hypothetical protein